MESNSSGDSPGRVDRAYTRVDHGPVRVGNQWLERVWSGFMGYTTSLIYRPSEFEWAARKNPEFSVEIDGETLSIDDFGEVEWSEECSDLGASLVGVYRHPALELRIEQLAFHEAPALLRTTTLFNSGRRKVKLGPVITENFVLDKPENCSCFMDLEVPSDPAAISKFNEIGAVVAMDYGLLFLAERKAQIILGSQGSAACSVRSLRRQMFVPSQTVSLDRSIIIAFEGDTQLALGRHVPDIKRRMRSHEGAVAKRERETE